MSTRYALVITCTCLATATLLTARLLPTREAAAAQDRPSQAIPSIQLVPGQGENLARVRFEVAGIDPATLKSLASANWTNQQWAQLFAVSVDDPARPVLDDRPDQFPVAGRYEVAGNVLRFIPRFPLDRGTRYRASLHLDRLPSRTREAAAAGSITALFTLPEKTSREPARLVKVEPAVKIVPENLLRLYLHFSAPMSRGEAYHRIELLDDQNQAIELPFLELGEELWDPTGQRLTLLIDPGRIKRGLVPNLEAGAVLEEGRQYTLAVDKNWPDASGKPLAAPFRHQFKAGPPVRKGLDPGLWTLRPPAQHSREALTIAFPEPLDHALAERLIHVEEDKGSAVAGEAAVSADARLWSFVPTRPWDSHSYRLAIGAALEDVAGNRIGRAFEVDETSPVTVKILTEDVYLPFKATP